MTRTFRNVISDPPVLASAVAIGATTATLATDPGTEMPTTGPFSVTIDSEVFASCSRSGTTLTLGSAATAEHAAGADVVHALSRADAEAFVQTDDVRPVSAIYTADAASTDNVALSGAQTLDGYLTGTGGFVLVKNQTDPTENNVYQTDESGPWTPMLDNDAALAGAIVAVQGGDTQTGHVYIQTTYPVEYGTDDVIFEQLGTYDPANVDPPTILEGGPVVPLSASTFFNRLRFFAMAEFLQGFTVSGTVNLESLVVGNASFYAADSAAIVLGDDGDIELEPTSTGKLIIRQTGSGLDFFQVDPVNKDLIHQGTAYRLTITDLTSLGHDIVSDSGSIRLTPASGKQIILNGGVVDAAATLTSGGNAANTISASARTLIPTTTFTANRTWTLPTYTTLQPGHTIRLIVPRNKLGSYTLTLDGNGSQTINGAATQVISGSASDREFVLTYADGEWKFGQVW